MIANLELSAKQPLKGKAFMYNRNKDATGSGVIGVGDIIDSNQSTKYSTKYINTNQTMRPSQGGTAKGLKLNLYADVKRL